jgi:hypothetical protein
MYGCTSSYGTRGRSKGGEPMKVIKSVHEWFREKFGTELPCGCIAADGRGARFSNDTTVTNREHNTVRSIEYRNCTKYENEWEFTIQCDHCGATWKKRERAGASIDYGEENPDAEMELERKHRGRHVIENEVPIIQNE